MLYINSWKTMVFSVKHSSCWRDLAITLCFHVAFIVLVFVLVVSFTNTIKCFVVRWM